ncbi:universal stress protein [Ramlibacter sp. Leaf400]|uniref:universal stress protein n=1 Tax=Ramlibacter sp. Leaf400 TaxID=1736365 RepID=UPI000700A5E7|nr:universal stress protein [Ramlibacter sp. Leaf400]KQT10849.1 universal stress protein UspA [Ramlibacter sp. Leaf400]
MYKRILVPVDGSETSAKALATAVEMARGSGGQIHLVHCVDELAYLGAYDYVGAIIDLVRENGAKVLSEAADTCRAAGVDAVSTFIDTPGQRLGTSIAKQATDWKADLIVVGTHGRRGVDRLVMGSGAEQIIRTAPAPVLVVRGGAAGPG